MKKRNMKKRSLAMSALLTAALAAAGCDQRFIHDVRYTNGNIKIQKQYKKYDTGHYHVHGPWYRWYPSGRMAEEGWYFRGCKNGNWITYADDDEGAVIGKEHYHRGILVSSLPVEIKRADVRRSTERTIKLLNPPDEVR